MKNLPAKIIQMGFDNWFQDKTDPVKLTDQHIARVIAVNKNSYLVSNGVQEVFSELTGKLLFNAASPQDFPAVGDWVYAQFFDDDSFAVIHEIIPRKTVLKRKTAGKKIDFQLIAANIDTAMIMQSLDANYNIRRLERYLVMIHESRIHPVVLLSKSDLLLMDEIEEKKSGIRTIMPDVQIVAFSNQNPADIDQVKALMIPGRTYCLLGSSGVGKTTLLNNLVDEERFETRTVRQKDDRGRHTTARRQLVVLENGAMVIDTPGMRELGVMSVESGIDHTFQEIADLADQCRFKDCTHVIEEGCALLDAITQGLITRERYENYIKMRKESLYHEMSYYEKRQKDKKFGRYIKSVIKEKKSQKS